MPNHNLQSVLFSLLLSAPCLGEDPVFPHRMPERKPDIELSSAMERMFRYPAPRVQDNELFSQFKYTRLKGFETTTVTARFLDAIRLGRSWSAVNTMSGTRSDTRSCRPSGPVEPRRRPIRFLRRIGICARSGMRRARTVSPGRSKGVAVPRPPKPIPGWRSVATPDILVWKGKYYLYYQAFVEPSGTKGDWCAVSASHADSPDGPGRTLTEPSSNRKER